MANEKTSQGTLSENVQSLGLNPIDTTASAAKEMFDRGFSQSRFDKGMDGFIERVMTGRASSSSEPADGARYAPSPQNFSQSFQPSSLAGRGLSLDPTAQRSAEEAEPEVSHPFKVSVQQSSPSSWVATVVDTSELFRSLDHTATVAIDALGTNLSVDDGDVVWLEIEFTSWPGTYTAEVKAGAFPAGGEIENDSGTPPVQTFARKVLATIEADGSALVANQIVVTNLQMRMFADAGLVVNYPMPA